MSGPSDANAGDAVSADGRPSVRPGLPALVFLAATVVMTWPMAAALGDQYTSRQDYYLNLWILDWVARAVTTPGLELFHSSQIFYPVGVGLETQPLSLPQSLTAVPLTLALGPQTTFNLLTLCGFWLAGWAACRWVTSLTGDLWAGLLAGLVFSFSVHHYSYIPQMGMAAIGFVPLFLWADLTFTRRPGVGRALLAGASLALVGMSAWYYGIILGLTAGVLSLRRLIRAPRDGRGPPWKLEVLFWLGCLAAMAPVVLRMLPAYVERPDMAGDNEYAGLALIIEKVKGTELQLPLSSYIGLVTLTLACVGALRLRTRWGLVVMAVGYVLLSFGSSLSVGDLEIPLPFALFEHLPVVSNVRYPDRFFVAAHVALAALAGWGLSDLRRRWRLGPTALVVLLLLPLAEVWPGPLPSVPASEPLPIPRAAAGDAAAVVTVPTTYRNLDGELLMHQTAHRRPVAGGYVTRPDMQLARRISREHSFGVFRNGQAHQLPEDLAARLTAEGVGWLCVQRAPWVAGTPAEPLSTWGPFSLVAQDYLAQRFFPVYDKQHDLASESVRWEATLRSLLGEPAAETARYALFRVPPR